MLPEHGDVVVAVWPRVLVPHTHGMQQLVLDRALPEAAPAQECGDSPRPGVEADDGGAAVGKDRWRSPIIYILNV